eukprot:g3575.t1
MDCMDVQIASGGMLLRSGKRTVPPLSKNALKRQRKKAYLEQRWREQKLKKRELKRMARADRESRAAFGRALTGCRAAAAAAAAAVRSPAERAAQLAANKARDAARREERARLCAAGVPMVIDCGFDALMTPKEQKSLVQQIMFSYGLNRRAKRPCTLHLTDLGGGGATARGLRNIAGFEQWAGVVAHAPPLAHVRVEAGEPDRRGRRRQAELVYLTSDAEEVLEGLRLDGSEAYVLGGIVDRNRLQFATLHKARELGLRAARLPLAEHCTLPSTPVLTVNHVVGIMLHWCACRDWAAAMEAVLPLRKGAKAKKKSDEAVGAGRAEEEAGPGPGPEPGAGSQAATGGSIE